VDIDKFAILKDNKDKIGIYRWVNLDTGKSYVGSSRNLSARFKQYFSVNYLEREIKRNNSKIYRSLFKKGYSKFSLDIVEYCEIDILIEREQYYLDTLKPEYNILSKAGSLAGFKHSVAARELMSLKKNEECIIKGGQIKNSYSYQPRSIYFCA
jgi:group I intron endonuclease